MGEGRHTAERLTTGLRARAHTHIHTPAAAPEHTATLQRLHVFVCDSSGFVADSKVCLQPVQPGIAPHISSDVINGSQSSRRTRIPAKMRML